MLLCFNYNLLFSIVFKKKKKKKKKKIIPLLSKFHKD